MFKHFRMFVYRTLYHLRNMGNEQIIQVTAKVQPQPIVQQPNCPPQVQAQPEITAPVPHIAEPQILEPIPNTSNVEMVQPSNPNPTEEDEENFLTEIYNKNKQASLPNLKQKPSPHRGSLIQKAKRPRFSNELQVASKMVSQGRVNKENMNRERKPRSVVSSYKCTIEDCEDELLSSYHV